MPGLTMISDEAAQALEGKLGGNTDVLVLSGRVPDLPINAAAMVPDDPYRTLRQRQMVTRAAVCRKCYHWMDERGLPFEGLDH